MGRVVIVFAVAIVAVLVAFYVIPPFGSLGVSQ
jgi:hypothetical protein